MVLVMLASFAQENCLSTFPLYFFHSGFGLIYFLVNEEWGFPSNCE